ncbi:MAG: hypothetical protein ACO1SX_20195 [Actinomycetota bacterium]
MKWMTKKDLAELLHRQGVAVDAIADMLQTDPSYVANALIERGVAPDYTDLYTSTGPQNRYAARLAGVLRFKDVEAARESVRQLDRLCEQYESERDRRGVHQCEVLALTGKNRAQGLGKWEEARIFASWLAERLYANPEQAPAEPTRLSTADEEQFELAA